MRELAYTASAERHELFAALLVNELLAARALEAPEFLMLLPTADGADLELPVPGWYGDVLGERSRRTLALPEALHRYVDLGGRVRLGIAGQGGRPGAASLSLAEELRARGGDVRVRVIDGLSTFAAVGTYGAVESTMAPGAFRLQTGIFRYFGDRLNVDRLRTTVHTYIEAGAQLPGLEGPVA